jgi:RND family efflux transporter MFP subunit
MFSKISHLLKSLAVIAFKSKKRIVLTLVLIGVLVYAFKPFGLFKSPSPSDLYKSEKVARADLSTTITASGIVEADNQATISFLTGGRVAGLYFNEGEKVLKGQVIASLDATEAQQTVSKAEASYHSAQSAVTKVLDDIRLSRGSNNGTDETMTQKNLRETAEAARDVSYQSLQTAQKQLQWTTIVAPFDGVISDISGLEIGQNVTAASGTSVTVVGSGDLKFKANIDEIDYSRLSLGQKGEIILDAFPEEKIAGQISKIWVAATKLPTGGSVIPVEITLPQDGKLKSGLNGEVTFTIVARENVLLIPRTALRKDNGDSYTNVLNKDKIEKKTVKVGEALGNKVEISSGLNEGDLVILGDVKK